MTAKEIELSIDNQCGRAIYKNIKSYSQAGIIKKVKFECEGYTWSKNYILKKSGKIVKHEEDIFLV
jgi:uncharacterized protein YxeA